MKNKITYTLLILLATIFILSCQSEYSKLVKRELRSGLKKDSLLFDLKFGDTKNDFFDLEVETPFMLKVCYVLKDKQDIIPAVTHVDGSARLQTVRRETHPRYYDLIKKLGDKTGVPVVLNTSFNIQGEPIVESPKDAIRCFYSTGLDALIIGNYYLTKSKKIFKE